MAVIDALILISKALHDPRVILSIFRERVVVFCRLFFPMRWLMEIYFDHTVMISGRTWDWPLLGIKKSLKKERRKQEKEKSHVYQNEFY